MGNPQKDQEQDSLSIEHRVLKALQNAEGHYLEQGKVALALVPYHGLEMVTLAQSMKEKSEAYREAYFSVRRIYNEAKPL